MKQVILLISLWCCVVPAHSQIFNDYPIYWSVFVYKQRPGSDSYEKFPGNEVEITLSYKTPDGEIDFIEYFQTTLTSESFVNLELGKGQVDPESPTEFYYPSKGYKTICYTIDVTTDEGSEIIMGEHNYGSAPYAIFSESSENAGNADALGNIPWVGDNVDPDPTNTVLENSALVIAQRDSILGLSRFNQIPFSSVLTRESAPSAVNSEPVEYFESGAMFGVPFVHDPDNEPIPEIENFITHCFRPEEKFFNGIGFKFKNTGGPALSHPTAAVYAENIYDPQGVGLFSNGRSRGSYNQGQTGTLGICNNATGNGAGVWGYIGLEPASGNANYALLASTNGFTNTYAAYLQGNVLYTGTLTGPSDLGLKTEIRSENHGLKDVLRLRPTTFQYRSDAPYSLPDGIHHGFIAQEVEEIMPELVSQIPLMADTGPDEILPGEIKNFKGLNYIEFIPVLTKAIQELNAELQEMKALLDLQAVQIEQLNKALEASGKPK